MSILLFVFKRFSVVLWFNCNRRVLDYFSKTILPVDDSVSSGKDAVTR